jgi:integrase
MADRANLTIRTVEALKPKDDEYMVWDKTLPAFGVRVSPGGTKAFLLKYRFAGQQRKVTLGRLGEDMTVAEARDAAERARRNVRDGVDPQADKDRDRAQHGITFTEAYEKFCTYRKELPFKRRPPLKPKTLINYRSTFKVNVAKALGGRPLASITRADIETLQERLMKKGHKATANRLMAYLGAFFTWAIDREFCQRDPTKNITPFPEKPRERVLDDGEFERFLAAVDAYDGNLYAKAALKLYVYTACRREEILTAKWTDVRLDGEQPHIRLRDAKTGDGNVPLPPEAVEVLRTLPRMPENPYVICGEKRGAHLVNISKPFKTVLDAAGIEGATIHDLRRTYGSMALKAGVGIFRLSKLFRHASVATTQRAYAFMPSETLHDASQQVAERMRETAAGKHAKVVRFAGRAVQ